MATTSPDGQQHSDITFVEHDKLGPLGSKAAVLESDTELRRVLVREFATAAEAARDAAASVDADVEDAVHDYRKALRRARAVLSLVSGALPKTERKAVRRALREARRTLGNARDHAVAPETVSNLPLGAEDRATADAILAGASEAMPPASEIKQLLAEGAARAAAQVEALEAALPPELAWDCVLDGVRAVYAQARRARKAARSSKRAFHTWRRRSKELTYQLDLLAGLAGMHTAELQREVEGITDAQSPAVDLIMLRDFVRTHDQNVAGDALDHLLTAVDAQLDDLMKETRRAGREVFRRKPRRFVKRLEKAVRRDLEPIAAIDEA